MLVLSRKNQEKIHIGDDIVITVVEIRQDKIRIGIEAPRETPVHRSEIYEKIRDEVDRDIDKEWKEWSEGDDVAPC